jgi:hypothetical protein
MEQNRYRYTISQSKKIQKLLDKSIMEILHKVGQDTVNKLKVYVNQYWYSRYSPEDYQRTYSFLESVSYEVKKNVVTIKFDTEKFAHATTNGWGQHRGFDGDDFNEGLIEFIETGSFSSGKTGSLSNPRIGSNGSRAIEKTRTWLNKHLSDEVKKQVKSKLGVTMYVS